MNTHKDILKEALQLCEEHGYRPESGSAVVEWYEGHSRQPQSYEGLLLIGALVDLVEEARSHGRR